MNATKTFAATLWVLVLGGNVIQLQSLPPQAFIDAPRLPWQIVFLPILVMVSAFWRRSFIGEATLERWVDGKFGPGTNRNFWRTLRLELLFATMCIVVVLGALARALIFKWPIMTPEIIGFFASGSVAFLGVHFIRQRQFAA